MFDVYKIRKDFPMLRGEKTMQGHPLAYLDNASTTFKPDCVIQAMVDYYENGTANSHRGDYDLCYAVDMKVSESRRTVAKFLNADENEIVFTAGTTASLNLVAWGYALHHLGKDDEVLLSEAEHASNLLPWYEVAKVNGMKIRMIPLDEKGAVSLENFKSSITPATKLVSVAQVSNVLGNSSPIKEMAEICHQKGIVLSVDGAQSVPHMKVDVKDLDCDFLSFSGHKLCGPTGTGVLYGKKELLEIMSPYESGGGNNVRFDSCGNATYLPAPAKFEAGTLNLAGIIGLKAAIDYLSGIGMEEITAHERELKAYAVSELKSKCDCKIYNETTPTGIVDFNVPGVFAQDAATYLNSKGIACRSGQHCAKILVDYLGDVATVRASFYLYTTKEEIDALVKAVSTCGGEFLNAYFI